MVVYLKGMALGIVAEWPNHDNDLETYEFPVDHKGPRKMRAYKRYAERADRRR